MTKTKIAIIEDEPDLQELIDYNLKKAGYETKIFADGETFLSQLQEMQPDLILLDLMLPGIDGFEVCRRLKTCSYAKDLPIIMLTAKSDEVDVITGLELGAADYVVKPFSPRVLIARIRTSLRIQPQELKNAKTIRMHAISLDPVKREVYNRDAKLDLTNTEFKLLQMLMGRAGQALNREQIVDLVHGTDYPVTDRSVDVQILGLRRKLGDQGQYIETVRGYGYKFRE
jgi:two-component system alkaline phosphatase synthesis response regulator PhoP